MNISSHIVPDLEDIENDWAEESVMKIQLGWALRIVESEIHCLEMMPHPMMGGFPDTGHARDERSFVFDSRCPRCRVVSILCGSEWFLKRYDLTFPDRASK